MKITRSTYVAGYVLAPVPGMGWMATGIGTGQHDFHKDLFGIGDTPEQAAAALARAIRDALHSPLAAARGWAPGRFDQIVLMLATRFAMDDLSAS
ncbi:hypothetical protein [Actinoplanes sp. G11-F43]|uniref:hypothetical protein n=1 Tax=Actinoplanes sp. G11-F43 TaxID=3424130 RepID=UPI003D33F284